MSKPTFVYVTYIGSRPEKVWQALTDGEFTKQYWGNRRNASDWKVGSPWRHEDFDDASFLWTSSARWSRARRRGGS